MATTEQQIQTSLSSFDKFRDVDHSDYQYARLGGLTNLVFRLEPVSARGKKLFGGNIIVRIPGEGTHEYIDRAVEAHNAVQAAKAGVSPQVICANPKSGVMVSRCIDDIVTMSPEKFRARGGSAARAGEAFKKLHNSANSFKFRFELFAMIDEYLGLLAGKQISLPDGYHDVVAAAAPIKSALAQNPGRLAPCHCDPLCENFLDTGERMWIVDWEYSGQNDPLWDLGDLSVEAGFDGDQDAEMLTVYCGGKPDRQSVARMIIYKAMCDLLWTLWGLIQHANDNPAEDFWEYAITRFKRCRQLMESPGFDTHVHTIATG